MASASPNPYPTTIVTGLEMDEKKEFIWKIDGMNVIRRKNSLIKKQTMSFKAGLGIGHPSTWALRLDVQKVTKKGGKRWVGVLYTVEEPSPANCSKDLHSSITLQLRNKNGKVIWIGETVKQVSTFTRRGWGFGKMIDADAFKEESLSIHVEFKLYVTTCFSDGKLLDELVEKAEEKFMVKVQKDMLYLLQQQTNTPSSTITMVSNDGREFLVYDGILRARSSLFEGLHKLEAINGVIKVEEFSGKTLEVLLQYLYAGKLHPDWKECEVVVDLTLAAYKYQLADMLDFLDTVLGRVCDLQNAGILMTMAQGLGMKTAHKELSRFVRMNQLETLTDEAEVADEAEVMETPSNPGSVESVQTDQA